MWRLSPTLVLLQLTRNLIFRCGEYPLTFLFTLIFFNDTASTEIYTLSLHDALPISRLQSSHRTIGDIATSVNESFRCVGDRKSTRLNSSHANISYAVFCLKKKIYKSGHSRPVSAKNHQPNYNFLHTDAATPRPRPYT